MQVSRSVTEEATETFNWTISVLCLPGETSTQGDQTDGLNTGTDDGADEGAIQENNQEVSSARESELF